MKAGDKVWIVKEVVFKRQISKNLVAVSVTGSDNQEHLRMVKPEQVHVTKPETNEVLAKRIAELERQLVAANCKLGRIAQAWLNAMLSDTSATIIALREAIEGS